MPIATLADVKRQLNIDSQDDSQDEELQEYLDAVVPGVVFIAGPVDNIEVVERQDGGGDVLALGVSPVVAVESVTDLAGDPVVDAGDLYVDREVGSVELIEPGRFPRRLVVTYTAGRGGECPPNVRLATLVIVQHLWRTQRGSGGLRIVGESTDEVVAAPGFGFLIPNRAYELLRSEDRGPRIA